MVVAPSRVGRWSPLWTAVGAALLIVVGLLLVDTAFEADRDLHFGMHLALLVPVLLLAVGALRVWPPPVGRLGTTARRLVVTGLLLFVLGNALEAIGAWGYDKHDDTVEVNHVLAWIHNLGVPGTPLGLLFVLAGSVLAALNIARRRGTSPRLLVITGAALVAAVAVLFYLAATTDMSKVGP